MLQSISKTSYSPLLLVCKPLLDESNIISDDFRALFKLWKEWRKSESLPEWSCFDPLDHVKLLPHVLLVEFHLQRVEDIQIILMGEHVKNFLGYFPKGTPFCEAMSPESFEEVVETNRFCAETANAAYFVKSMGWKARDYLAYELLKLPFMKPCGKIGCVCLMRFGLDDSQVETAMETQRSLNAL